MSDARASTDELRTQLADLRARTAQRRTAAEEAERRLATTPAATPPVALSRLATIAVCAIVGGALLTMVVGWVARPRERDVGHGVVITSESAAVEAALPCAIRVVEETGHDCVAHAYCTGAAGELVSAREPCASVRAAMNGGEVAVRGADARTVVIATTEREAAR